MNEKQKVSIVTTVIAGACTIISATIGCYFGKQNAYHEVFNQATNTVNIEIDNIDGLLQTYQDLEDDISDLKNTNEELEKRNESLNSNAEYFASLADENSRLLAENNKLINQIEELQFEMESVKNSNTAEGLPPISGTEGKKTSVFELTTFRGYDRWYNRSDLSDSYFVDTYDNEYPNAHIGEHHSCNEDELDDEPTYLLEGKYTECRGHFAWSKEYKNDDGSAWIDFYSGKTHIGTSPVITADSRETEFSCDITGVEKLTIVLNGSGYECIIYSEFDFIE